MRERREEDRETANYFVAHISFQTIGKIFLKMVVDGRPLPDAFAPSFFKFLLGIPPNLQDLEAYLTLPLLSLVL